MNTYSASVPQFDSTGSTVMNLLDGVRELMRRATPSSTRIRTQTSILQLSVGVRDADTLGDPEDRLIQSLRDGEIRSRRATARLAIEAKRRVTSYESLLALRNSAPYRIEISKESLEDLLDSFPGDD